MRYYEVSWFRAFAFVIICFTLITLVFGISTKPMSAIICIKYTNFTVKCGGHFTNLLLWASRWPVYFVENGCRARLSYEQFSSFLANIKELNAHRQTREVKLSVYTLSDPLLKSIRHLMWLIYVDKSSWCSYEKLLRAARTYLCGVLYDTASESICCTHCRRLWRMLRISLAQRTGTCMLHSKEF